MSSHDTRSPVRRVAYFVTPHGYGHASRAAAVMQALFERNPDVAFEIFTRVPAWFFQSSLSAPFGYHDLMTDVGLVQRTSLQEDMPETLRRLGELLPFDASSISRLADRVNELACRLVICDIAPMGIAVARQAGLPSVLVENFTWDWIYQGYLSAEKRLGDFLVYLEHTFSAADFHIQTEPVCLPQPSASLTTSPVSRKARSTPAQIRKQLGIPDFARMVLVTMGGIPWQYNFLEHLAAWPDVYFVVPGAGDQLESGTPPHSNVIFLPASSDFFHPDLVNACDAVIGKAGYSTVAEVYWAGTPFGFVSRPRFRESLVLADFVHQHVPNVSISPSQFEDGSWISAVPDVLALPGTTRRGSNGAEQVAAFVDDLLCSS